MAYNTRACPRGGSWDRIGSSYSTRRSTMANKNTYIKRVNREAVLVHGMVFEVLVKYFDTNVFNWEGKLEGMGTFDAEHPAHVLAKPLASLREIGENPTQAKLYWVKGTLTLSADRKFPFEANCKIFRDRLQPRAAFASLVVPSGTYWYEFIHKINGPGLIREVQYCYSPPPNIPFVTQLHY
jgi:hypothetical protein